MPRINVLERSVYEIIAAGEVVERPSSVVKELVENSIDAGASRITVEIRKGGNTYIRITDNGCGIRREDVPKAFISHATSKISSAADLDAILTLGFRGEALASVAAVSKTEMLTKSADEEMGTRYVIEGGREVLIDDAGCPDGTTIIVADLFYNTPARMKFLKKDVTEGNYISDIIQKVALSHPEISFRLIKDDKQTLLTSGDGKTLNTAFSILGKEFSASLIPCSYELSGVKISGFISKPLAGRPNRNMQFCFVNNRYVRIPSVAAALDGAYKNSIMVGKFPCCIINIGIAAQCVDVNVHPAKTEVRFADEKKIFEAVYYAAKSALVSGDTRPEAIFDRRPESRIEKINTPAPEQIKFSETKHEPETGKQNPSAVSHYSSDIPDIINTAEHPNESIKTDGRAVHTVDSASSVAMLSDVGRDFYASDNNRVFSSPLDRKILVENDDDEISVVALPETDSCNKKASDEVADTLENTEVQAKEKKPYRIVGEVFKTYIIIERSGKLLYIDKHALHERMIFNSLKNSIDGSRQLLLSPVHVRLARNEYSAVLENLELLLRAGFVVEDFGEGDVIVRECPQVLDCTDIGSIITELANTLISRTNELLPEKLDRLYHSAACRAAVKAGSALKDEETQALISRFFEDESIMYCPHGRPVMIELSRYELEKQFGRIQ